MAELVDPVTGVLPAFTRQTLWIPGYQPEAGRGMQGAPVDTRVKPVQCLGLRYMSFV